MGIPFKCWLLETLLRFIMNTQKKREWSRMFQDNDFNTLQCSIGNVIKNWQWIARSKWQNEQEVCG